MREVRRSALVPYSPEQMYALVNDVRRYPEFLQWCPATRVHEETPESITATVDMQRAGVRVALTTRNTMRPGELIDMTLVDGPLGGFSGGWRFIPIRAPAEGDTPGALRGCRVRARDRLRVQERGARLRVRAAVRVDLELAGRCLRAPGARGLP